MRADSRARRHARAATTLLGTTALLCLTVPAATAAEAQTYHGTWDDAAACGTSYDATGRWTVVLRDDGTAVVTVRIALDGRTHAAWGIEGFDQLAPAEGETFSVTRGSFGFVLHDSGHLVYTITDYPCGDGTTDTAVLHGASRA